MQVYLKKFACDKSGMTSLEYARLEDGHSCNGQYKTFADIQRDVLRRKERCDVRIKGKGVSERTSIHPL
jgi:hypothetical protein